MKSRQAYVDGNLAKKPIKRKQIKKRSSVRKISRQEINKKAKIKQDRNFMFFLIVMITMGGLLTITIETKIYNMQNNLNSISKNIQLQREIQSDLHIKTMRYSSIKNIEDKASSELNMFIPKEEDIIKIDFSDNYFRNLNDKSPHE